MDSGQPMIAAHIKRYAAGKFVLNSSFCDSWATSGHHGDISKDSPKPTSLRYCINGIAYKFVPA
jgi:peptide methionine sulfoxide reductase MsrB